MNKHPFPRHVMGKALKLRQQLLDGKPWKSLGGRQFRFCEALIVFELPGSYGLVCRYHQHVLVRCQLLNRAQYKNLASNSCR